MSSAEIQPLLERQLLLQLGDRLRRLRKAQRLGTVELATRAGIARNTLRAVEAGDPAPSIGTYVRVMSLLGVGADLALLAGDALQPAPADSAAARSLRAAPLVRVQVSVEQAKHQWQDAQSLALHEEAVRRAKADPALVQQAQGTLERWLATGDARSAPLWREWQTILHTGTWRKVLGRSHRAQQLRQASPLVTTLPQDVRQHILQQAAELKQGVHFHPWEVQQP